MILRSTAFLAQWLERVAVNHKVVGSIPTGGVLCVLLFSVLGSGVDDMCRGTLTRDRSKSHDTVSEWLRRWTRNPLGSAREGSNPFGVVFVLCQRRHANLSRKIQRIMP